MTKATAQKKLSNSRHGNCLQYKRTPPRCNNSKSQMFRYYAANRLPCHTGRHNNYSYNRMKFLAIFNKYDAQKDRNLGRSLNGKQSTVARKVGLQRIKIEYGTVNSAQVSHNRKKTNENDIYRVRTYHHAQHANNKQILCIAYPSCKHSSYIMCCSSC